MPDRRQIDRQRIRSSFAIAGKNYQYLHLFFILYESDETINHSKPARRGSRIFFFWGGGGVGKTNNSWELVVGRGGPL